MSSTNKCAVCGVPCSLKCVGCKQVFYCGKDHQKEDWNKGHKKECTCYEIVENQSLGRYMRATRDIKQGEIILQEPPFIYGPKMACFPLCLGCHRKLDTPADNYYKCRSCTWPLCGPDCEKSPLHEDECKLMASRKFSSKINYNPSNDVVGKKESCYCVILPLRCMLLKQKNPKLYEKFASLEDHLRERYDTPIYQVLRANLVTFIQTVLGMTDWSEEEILRIAARLDTNAFEVRQMTEKRLMRAIYLKAAMFSHDCVCNARHTFDKEMNIIFIAKRPIAKGEIISSNYSQPLQSTLMRREYLANSKCFDCTCKRCQDPTELNTFVGSIICIKCKVGKMISTNPMDNSADWHCQICSHVLTAKRIAQGNNSLLKEIEALEKTSVKAFEEFLFRYREILHEKNTHVLQVKYALIQLYGNAPGYSFSEMNDAAFSRKIDLCKELLDVAEVLEGGLSIFRGKLLLELEKTMFAQIKRQYSEGLITYSQTLVKFELSMLILNEAIEIMRFEPDMNLSFEDRMMFLHNELNVDSTSVSA